MIDAERSVIMLSTPTSANGSLFRSITAIGHARYRAVPWVNDLIKAGRIEDVARLFPPASGCLIKHNAPERFNPATPLAHYRFILNARDPRDLACNQYHWQFSHPSLNETEEETRLRRARVADAGIDAFVLAQDNTAYLRGFLNVARRIAPGDRIFVGYAMYCLHFDEVVARIADFLGVALEQMHRKQRKFLTRERVENLGSNRVWIGSIWAGADTAPGRHRQELQPETIRALNQRYAWFLEFLRHMDDPRVCATYDS